jgi:hypothetical protein
MSSCAGEDKLVAQNGVITRYDGVTALWSSSMTGIVLDDALRAKLNGLNTIVPVKDEAGRFVGGFVPESLFLRMFEAWADSEVTDSELEAGSRAYRERGGLPTAEAIQYVRRMAGEPVE